MMSRPKRVLFVCEGNLHRSPTAEDLYSATAGLEVRSAGTSSHARVEVTDESLDWADVVFVMDTQIGKRLARRFPDRMKAKPVHSLNVPDVFRRVQPELIALLTERLTPYLGPPGDSGELLVS